MLLDHYNKLRTPFLHANGERGTEFLLQKLSLVGTEKVLEIGFGTGATLVKLKSRFPELKLYGIEADQKMIDVAKHRLGFCNLKNKITLLHIQNHDQVPAYSMDVVFAESVLGIQDIQTLENSLRFAHRILKPDGILAVNESIWLASATTSEIAEINARCMAAFGIIQCNEQFAGTAATLDFFRTQGFSNLYFEKIDPQVAVQVKRKNYREFLSRAFTIIGKLQLLFNPRLRKTNTELNSEMKMIFRPGKKYLSGCMMIFKKA